MSGRRHFVRQDKSQYDEEDDEEHDLLHKLASGAGAAVNEHKEHIIRLKDTVQDANVCKKTDLNAKTVIIDGFSVEFSIDAIVDLINAVAKPRTVFIARNQSKIAAIAAFEKQKDAETAHFALENKYLGRGRRVSARIPKHSEIQVLVNLSNEPIHILSSELAIIFLASDVQQKTPFGALQSTRSLASVRPLGDSSAKRLELQVQVPLEIRKLRIIHRLIDAIITHGPIIESLVMERNGENEDFEFLFNNYTEDHIYYRWRLFSLLNGDSPYKWSLQPFQMYSNSVWWIPPQMPQENDEAIAQESKQLPPIHRLRLEETLRNSTTERRSIARITKFAIDHAFAAEQIADTIISSIIQPLEKVPVEYQLMRFYTIHDILHNASCGVRNVWRYRQIFEAKLEPLFRHFVNVGATFQGRLRGEKYWSCIHKVLEIWKKWIIFTEEKLNLFVQITHGQTEKRKIQHDTSKTDSNFKHTGFANSGWKVVESRRQHESDSDRDSINIDGEPINLDGEAINLEGEAFDLVEEASYLGDEAIN